MIMFFWIVMLCAIMSVQISERILQIYDVGSRCATPICRGGCQPNSDPSSGGNLQGARQPADDATRKQGAPGFSPWVATSKIYLQRNYLFDTSE